METEYFITLPYPPSVNRLYKRRRGGGVRLSDEAVVFKQWVAVEVYNRGIVEPLEGDLAVDITVYRPAKRGDLDNLLKITLDSLNKLLWKDDKQITVIHAVRLDDKHHPRIEVFARVLPQLIVKGAKNGRSRSK
jgi:crossover junction endodeoxyribonuclease RusA